MAKPLRCFAHSKEPQNNATQGDNDIHFPEISKHPHYGKKSDPQRMIYLSTPKTTSYNSNRCLGKRIRYAQDQETLLPISEAALSAHPTLRLEQLANPKIDFQKLFGRAKLKLPEFLYSCGRTSTIWKVKESAKNFVATPRLEELAQPRHVPTEYKKDSSSRPQSRRQQHSAKQQQKQAADEERTQQETQHTT